MEPIKVAFKLCQFEEKEIYKKIEGLPQEIYDLEGRIYKILISMGYYNETKTHDIIEACLMSTNDEFVEMSEYHFNRLIKNMFALSAC